MYNSQMTGFHVKQVSHLQCSIWALEKARDNITVAIGNSELGGRYLVNITEMIGSVQDDIDNIMSLYREDKE